MIDPKRINRRKLREVAEKTRAGDNVGMTVRQLLALFGAKRRGSHVQWFVESELQKLGMGTKPSFKVPTGYDTMVRFVVRPTRAQIQGVLHASR